MIEYKKGDLLQEDAEALVNSVNCVGIMGRGVALEFKRAWPDNFKAYQEACRRGEVEPGRMFIFETGRLTNPLYIINFPTKRHWRQKSRLEDIEAGLRALVEDVRRLNIGSIALPPLGCGLGGLRWSDVRRLIEQVLGALSDVRVIVYEPAGQNYLPRSEKSRSPLRMTSARAALIYLMERYLAGLLDPTISLLEVHKLLYFLQESGEPLKLRFRPGPYGPYAENLRYVLRVMEGHFISGYGSVGDDPCKELKVLPDARMQAHRVLAGAAQTQRRVERVGQLVEGFESPHGLELLATTHWIVSREEVSDKDALVRRFHEWAERKRQFTREQIILAADVLKQKGWIEW